jgi:hypothetical protein
MYVEPNFKTKKAFREHVKEGKAVVVFQPNNMFGVEPPANGKVCIEGPHYPQPHRWYATAHIKDGKVVKVT